MQRASREVHDGRRVMKKNYKIASPQEAAKNIIDDKLTGKNNWFNSHRFRIVAQFLPNSPSPLRLLDYGCGNGIFLSYLCEHNYSLYLHGYDPYLFTTCSKMFKEKNVYIHKQLENIYYQNFDIICGLDVIEHIEDDSEALVTIHTLLKTGGLLLLTVPAYQFLYSHHDATLGHYRRYTKKSISSLIQKAGFCIKRCDYFFSFLIPASFIMKYYLSLKKFGISKLNANNLPSNPLGIFSILAHIEFKLMALNYSLPFGTSIFVCATKR